MWLPSKEGALEKRRTSKLYAMEKEITVSEEWYKGLMGALDAQEASVLSAVGHNAPTDGFLALYPCLYLSDGAC